MNSRYELVRKQVALAELDLARGFFAGHETVLELGAGDGFQAEVMAKWCRRFVAIDLHDRDSPPPVYSPIIEYDGVDMPLKTGAFDVVYSSSVLVHVADLPAVLRESRRVVKQNGILLHVMPTPVWRLWTSALHPFYVLSILGTRVLRHLRSAGREDQTPGGSASDPSDVPEGPPRRRGSWRRAVGVLTPNALGAGSSATEELLTFRRRHWIQLFEDNGFQVENTVGSRLFYTGQGMMPGLGVNHRRTMARCFGSVSRLYVLRRADSDACSIRTENRSPCA